MSDGILHVSTSRQNMQKYTKGLQAKKTFLCIGAEGSGKSTILKQCHIRHSGFSDIARFNARAEIGAALHHATVLLKADLLSAGLWDPHGLEKELYPWLLYHSSKRLFTHEASLRNWKLLIHLIAPFPTTTAFVSRPYGNLHANVLMVP